MKRIVLIVSIISLQFSMAAQPKEFEGRVVYNVSTKSKTEGVNDKVWKNLLALGDSMSVIIKQGNYRQTTGPVDIFMIAKDEKAYFKFKGIDTLYYLDYASDTSSVVSIERPAEKRSIAGYECKVITVKGHSVSRKYYYAPALHMNPEYDKNNRLSQYNIFARETSSLYLGYFEENEGFAMSQTCTSVEPGLISNNVFELPKLPQKVFSPESITMPAKFPRPGGFNKFIQATIDPSVSSKYLKIPRGEDGASQTAVVVFMINERGRVVNARVVNKDEVHPKIAEEAVRVVSASPPWTPPSVLGENVFGWYKQLITFQVSKK
jgi:hypothetical protein